jgi:hypothetical protein
MKNARSQITRPAKFLVVAAAAFSVCGLLGTIHVAGQPAPAQSSAPAFDGGNSTWHDDFLRSSLRPACRSCTFAAAIANGVMSPHHSAAPAQTSSRVRPNQTAQGKIKDP